MLKNFNSGWRQVGVCFMLLGAAGMIAATWSIVAAPFEKEFGVNRATLGFGMTVLSATGVVLTPLLGSLMDRFSVRILMMCGGLSLAAGYAAMSFATSFQHILIILALFVAPANVMLGPVAATVLLSRWFSENRGRAIGIAIAGVSAGGFLFPFIIGGLLQHFDWRDALRGLALVQLLWTLPAALLAIDRPSDRGLLPDGKAAHLNAAPPAQDPPVSVPEVLRQPAFWMIAVTVAIVTAGMKGMITNITQMASDTGIKAQDAAIFVSIYAGFSFISKLSFAALADWVGPRVLMMTALGGFAVGMACLTQASSGYWVIAGSIACIGLFGGLMVPIEAYLSPRVFGQRTVGRAMGLLSGVILIALLSTPPLFGLISDLTGSYRGILWTFSGLALAGVFWVPYIQLGPLRNDVE